MANPMQSIDCGKLTTGIVGFDCENPPVAGIKPNVILFNLDDIDHTATKIENGVITDLVLKTGEKAYLANTRENGIDASVTFNKGTYINSWTHSFTFRLFDNSPEAKRFVHGLEKSRIVAIVQNNYVKNSLKDENQVSPAEPEKELKGETVFEVYGFNSGLVLTEGTRDPKDAETAGAYVLTVTSDENAKEPTVPITLFNKSLKSTEEILDLLVNPV